MLLQEKGHPEGTESTYRQLDDLLNQGRVAEITYDFNFLRKDPVKNRYRSNIPGDPRVILEADAEIAHSSVVVGRRRHPVTGVCQYKIRNSMGPDCSIYAPEIECENGHFWVSKDELEKNTKGISWID
jgi:hypothetical protein